MDYLEAFLALLTGGRDQWPPKSQAAAWKYVRTYAAFLESDREALKVAHDWPAEAGPYKVDPLPDRIAVAWADHAFGEDPKITPANKGDQGYLDELLEGDFAGALHDAQRRNVGEGEVWWRVFVDRESADRPLLEWHSRLSVIPLYFGETLKAAGLVTVLEGKGTRRRSSKAVWRHFEIHQDGCVDHRLYVGTAQKLGESVPLDEHPETADVAATLGENARWSHELPMLMGKVINRPGRHPRLGRSEFETIQDPLLDLNEAMSIGSRNMRLTAKKRAMVPESAVTPATSDVGGQNLVDRGDGSFDVVAPRPVFRDEDLIVIPNLDESLDGGNGPVPFKVLEYSFDAAPLIAWKRDLVETALTRIGLTPQWVGVMTEENAGLAISGTGLRIKLTPTTKGGHGKGKRWDDTVPYVLSLLAQVSALPEENLGFGWTWTDAAAPPAFARANPLPEDPVEEAQVESTLVMAGVRSTRESVRRLNPDWNDTQIDDEVDRIREDRASSAPAVGLGFGA